MADETCTYARCVADAAYAASAKEGGATRLESRLVRHPEEPCLLFELGALEGSLRRPGAAERLERAAELFASRGSREDEAWARFNAAEALRHARRLDDAQGQLELARTAAESTGHPALEALARVNLARLLEVRGEELAHALHMLREAEGTTCGPQGSYGHCKHALLSLGNIAQTLGYFSESQATFKRLQAKAEEAGDLHNQVTAGYNLANGRLDRAVPADRPRLVAEMEHLLALAERAQHLAATARIHHQLGKLTSDPAASTRHLELAVAKARALRQPALVSEMLQTRAAHAADPGEARRLLAEARQLAFDSLDPWPMLHGAGERIEVTWSSSPGSEAFEASLEVLTDIERLRDLQQDSTARAGFFAVFSKTYYHLAGRVLESATAPAAATSSPASAADAFEVHERLRARSLLDALEEAGVAPELPPDEAAERERTLGEIVAVQRRLLDPGLDPEERAEALGDLARAERREAELGKRLTRDHPDYAALSPPAVALLEEVAAGLGESEALLSFQVAPWQDVYGDFAGGSWLLLTTRGGTRTFRLPGRKGLEGSIEIFRGLIEQRQEEHVKRAAVELYRDLFQEALASLPPEIDALVLIPDGVLHLLPFAMLRESPEAPPLVQRYRLSAAPSATLWLRWRLARPPAVPPAALALAATEPSIPEGVHDAETAERFWFLRQGFRPTPLAGAAREAKTVVRRIGASSVLRLAGEANERFLKHEAELERFSILHFAAHAVVDENHPARSAILLADGGETEDGLLQFRDIAGLELDGKIAVLSACSSASGAVQRGEGVLSLARAFFQAGAHSVVGSLWPLRDDEATELMDTFYAHLGDGLSLAAALQAAQSELIESGAPAAAWAGLTVLGDGDFVPVPGGGEKRSRRSIVIAAVALGLVLVLAAFAFARRRASRRRSASNATQST